VDLSKAFKSLRGNDVSMPRTEHELREVTEITSVDAPVEFRRLSADEALGQALDLLATEIPSVRALVLGDRSGLPIASTFRSPTSMTTTAMATLALSAATKVTSSLNLPNPEDILIEAGGWRVLVRLLGNGFTLTSVFSSDENLGFVKLAMQSRGREIRDLLDAMA
jgi:predicted regulator of Ras-like GTPase activity (Roadblock/LC7/MglB family)